MTTRRIWLWHGRDNEGPQRRFNNAWWGGWWSRLAVLISVPAFIALERASSWEGGVRVGLPLFGFYTCIMVLGWLNNYVELEAGALKVSQMGIVTPGGPTYGGGRIQYHDILDITFIPARSVHIRYSGNDWRGKSTVRTTKLYLEHADEFV